MLLNACGKNIGVTYEYYVVSNIQALSSVLVKSHINDDDDDNDDDKQVSL